MITWADIRFFKPEEFDSPDFPGSGEKNMNLEIVKICDSIREMFGYPIQVTSGFRTPGHNKKIGGQPNSAHLRGLAVDLYIGEDSHKRYEIVRHAILMGVNRFEIAPVHVHLDIDNTLPKNVIVFLASYPAK